MTIIFLAILGAAVGSFLNVCIDRLPRRQSMLRPASHCDGCRVSLRWMELLPIISFLVLRGRCRYCQVSIPRRSPIVETIMAASFGLLVYYFSLGTQSAIFAFYIAIFTLIFFIDLERGIIPNRVIYPAASVAVLLSFFLPEVGLVRALIGGILGFGLLFGIYLAARGGIGGWRREAGWVDRPGRRISRGRSVSAASLPGRWSHRLGSAGIAPQKASGPGPLWPFPGRRSPGWVAVGNPNG